MLTPVTWPLTIYVGCQFNPLFEFFNDQGRTQPFNLTGFSAQLVIGGGQLVLSSAGGGLTLGGVAGTVQVYATALQTAGLVPASGVPWYLAWTPSGGQPDCPISGKCLITTP